MITSALLVAEGNGFNIGAGTKVFTLFLISSSEFLDPEIKRLKLTRRGMPNLMIINNIANIPSRLNKRFFLDCWSIFLDNLDLFIIKLSRRWESDPRLALYERATLPTELLRRSVDIVAKWNCYSKPIFFPHRRGFFVHSMIIFLSLDFIYPDFSATLTTVGKSVRAMSF